MQYVAARVARTIGQVSRRTPTAPMFFVAGAAVFSLCITTLARPAGAEVPSVAVRVSEEAGVKRATWPVTFTVPYARGKRVGESEVVVRDDTGKALPTQTRTFARWPDGSTRWLLVDTQLPIAGHETSHLRVSAGKSPAAAATLRVEESATAVRIDTGAIAFVVPRDRLALLDDLRLSGQSESAIGPVVPALESVEGQMVVAPPVSVDVVEKGPLRCQLRIRGDYGNGFEYEVRLNAFAGQPFVRIEHTFAKIGGGAFSELRKLSLAVPLRVARRGAYVYGVERAKPGRGELAEGASLRLSQPDNQHYEVDGSHHDGALAGWMEWQRGDFAVGVAGRWFWQEYPQAFQLSPERVVYELRAGDQVPQHVGIGAAKTHELTLWLTRRGDIGKRDAPALREPLVGVVDPAYLAATGALPGALIPPAGGFIEKLADTAEAYLRRNAREEWNDCGAPRCDEVTGQRRKGAFGMFNWGDWNFPGYEDDTKGTDAWGNLEYDTTQVLALSFAGSGRPRLYAAMTAAARHFMDVDVIHALPVRPQWVGMNHPKNPMHFIFDLGGVDLGHTWTEGLISYAYLTGDERGLAAARGIADYLVGRLSIGVRGNPRQWGWPQIALLAVYDATGEASYREAALQYALLGSAAHPAKGLKSWKGGILADALAHTHAATGNEQIKKWLDGYVEYIRGNLIHQDARYYPAIAYMAVLNGDTKLRERAAGVAARIKLGSWGKPFTSGGRIGLRILSLLQAAPPAVAAAPKTSDGTVTNARLP